MRRLLSLILVLVLIAGAVLLYLGWPDKAQTPIAQVEGDRPVIGQPRKQVIPTVGIADVVGWRGDAKPVPAAGLQVAAFTKGLDHPRWLYELSNGDVLVAESAPPPSKGGGGITGLVTKVLLKKAGSTVPSANRITLLRDTDGDGSVDARSALLTGLNSPFGMVVVGDWLYVGNHDALVRYPFRVGQTRIDARPETIVKYPGGSHWTRNVIANADGSRLFVAIGSATNIADKGLPAEKMRAMIIEVDPKTKWWRVYGAGLRNPVGMALEPRSGRLWTVVNERDMLGSDIVPDYLTSVNAGEHFGWPWYYWGGYPDPRIPEEDANPELQQYSKRPDYALGPHVAALGLTFAQNARLGSNLADGAFIGLHGSWNRKPPSGYKVVYVPFGENGYPVKGAKPVDVLTGFLNADGDAQGRPVGVIVDRRGGLLVADDAGNTVWRVTAKAAAAGR